MKTYTPSELAKIYRIHPNTVRLYERLGYLSMAERNSNNYRVFTELHALQTKICRCIFGYPFTTRSIRDAGNQVMRASAKQKWDIGKQYAQLYIQTIEQEIDIAQKTASILKHWANTSNLKKEPMDRRELSRKEIADYFDITVETVRNWERNGLIISAGKGERSERLYSSTDLDRMSVIYMLIQAGYSIAAIQRSFVMSEKGHAEEVVAILNHPKHDELVSVGDRWLDELLRLKEAAEHIPVIFDKLKSVYN